MPRFIHRQLSIKQKFGFSSDFCRILIKPVNRSSIELMALLRIAHKYCMQSIEDEILTVLKETKSVTGCIDLMAASQIVGCQELHEQALKDLKASQLKPNLEQAKRIGIETYYELMQDPPPGPPSDSRWVHCSAHQVNWVSCRSCKTYTWDHCSSHSTSWGCRNCQKI